MYQILHAILLHVGVLLLCNVLPTSAYCYYSTYGGYYCYSYSYTSVGTIVGAVVGAIFGLIILTVIIVIVCSQMKTRGLRGTVVQPTNQTNVSTVQYNSAQSGFAQPVSNYNYNQYPGASAPMYPPPQNMGYPPPGQNYGQPLGQNYGPPPTYDGTPMKQ